MCCNGLFADRSYGDSECAGVAGRPTLVVRVPSRPLLATPLAAINEVRELCGTPPRRMPQRHAQQFPAVGRSGSGGECIEHRIHIMAIGLAAWAAHGSADSA